MSINKADYQKKVIIFLDILGIKEFTAKITKNGQLNELVEIYSQIKNIVGYAFPNFNHPSFSDYNVDTKKILGDEVILSSLSNSIIISFPFEKLIFLPLVLRIAFVLQLAFLLKGLPLRGAVTIGNIYHKKEDTIIFGEGLVDAALLERDTEVPRVVIENKVLEEYKKFQNPQKIKIYAEYLQAKFPEMHGFESFLRIIKGLAIGTFSEHQGVNVVDYIDDSDTLKQFSQKLGKNAENELKTLVLKQIKKFKTDEHILKKWLHIKLYLESKSIIFES